MIEALPQEILTELKVRLIAENGARKICEYARKNEELKKLLAWANANSPAEAKCKIYDHVNAKSSPRIYMVGMSGGNPAFDNEFKLNGGALRIIFLDFDGKFAATASDGALTRADPRNSVKASPWGNFDPELEVKGTKVNPYHEMPLGIVAFHELGHAKQFIERPAVFADEAHGPLHGSLREIEAIAADFIAHRMAGGGARNFIKDRKDAKLNSSASRVEALQAEFHQKYAPKIREDYRKR